MPTERLAHPKYRRDIDGLRAIAVLSVVGFHAAPGRITGGFIGVDIFFVISGYLISTIILQNLDNDSFSFATFYERRIKRIFPALLCVLASCLVFGSLLFTADEFAGLGKQIAAGAGFYSNFLFWMESGYFDSQSSMKPLLHLWSLSIEEQFYIVWPLILWFLFRRKANILAAVIVLALASFIANVATVSTETTAVFYSPLTRSWELLAGAILAFSTLHRSAHATAGVNRSRNMLSIAGAFLVIAGLALINEHRLFPGWWVILPILGTVLLILATDQAWINRVLLSNPVLVWFGLISYPLYLTHWPILSFLRILESGEVSQSKRLVAVLVAIVISWLIYTMVEKPVRLGAPYRSKSLSLFAAMVFLWMGGFYVYQQQGLAARIGTPPLAVNSGDIGHRAFFAYMSENFYPCLPIEIRQGMEHWNEFGRCFQSQTGSSHDLALIGDSHAEHLFIGLAEALKELNIAYYTKGGAPFLSNPAFQDIFPYLAGDRDIKVVLISAKWGQALAGLDDSQLDGEFNRLLEFLTNANKQVYLIDDIPAFAFGPSKCKYAGRLGQENTCRQAIGATLAENKRYFSLFAELAEKYPNVKVLHTQDFFCDRDNCSMSSDGVLHYRDQDHLNVAGSKALWQHLMSNTTLNQGIARVYSE